MNSVGIITFHRIFNFGAALQAYALRRCAVTLGHRCEFIDVLPPVIAKHYRLFIISRRLAGLQRNARILRHLKAQLSLRAKFHSFFRERMGIGRRPQYTALEDLSHRPPLHDVFLSGSDMIWNPCFLDPPYKKCGLAYYLDFVKDGQGRKAAYASSFGVAEIPAVHRARIASLLNRYDHLSSREQIGCDFIRQLTGRTAEHVLDPTLLLTAGDYDEASVPPTFSGPYILLYPMEPSDLFIRLARKVRELLALPVAAVVPPNNTRPEMFNFADKVICDAGPAEFLGWMKAAAFVCTNSYHGTCFSLVYRKTFLGVPDSKSNIRVLNLLQRMGLADRQMTEPESLCAGHPLLEPMDYVNVEPRLQKDIGRSLTYLQRALT